MYLSRVVLSTGRATDEWLMNPYHIHQCVCMALPNDPRALYRLERDGGGRFRLLVQSSVLRPDWEKALDKFPFVVSYEFNRYEPRFAAGQIFAFRLRGCPSATRNARRYPLLDEAAQYAWLNRKLAAAGVGVLVTEIVMRERQRMTKQFADGRLITMTHHGVLFEGRFRVIEPGRLVSALRAGIGSAKGLGFGLLSIMSPR